MTDSDNILDKFRRLKKEIRQNKVGFTLKTHTKDNWFKEAIQVASADHMLNSEADIKEFSEVAITTLLKKLNYEQKEINDYDNVLTHFITEVHRIRLELNHGK